MDLSVYRGEQEGNKANKYSYQLYFYLHIALFLCCYFIHISTHVKADMQRSDRKLKKCHGKSSTHLTAEHVISLSLAMSISILLCKLSLGTAVVHNARHSKHYVAEWLLVALQWQKAKKTNQNKTKLESMMLGEDGSDWYLLVPKTLLAWRPLTYMLHNNHCSLCLRTVAFCHRKTSFDSTVPLQVQLTLKVLLGNILYHDFILF